MTTTHYDITIGAGGMSGNKSPAQRIEALRAGQSAFAKLPVGSRFSRTEAGLQSDG